LGIDIGFANERPYHAATQGSPCKSTEHSTRPRLESPHAAARSTPELKGGKCQEAEPEKTQWEHFTQNIIEAAFGDPSSELSRFHQARCAGSYNVMGISLQQQQRNFDLQVQEC
jgi:hypothetical protein